MFRKLTLSLTLLFIVGSIGLTGCATQNKISQDFNPNTNFKSIKTFTWRNFSSEIAKTDNVTIKNTVEQALTQQGWQLTTDKADVILDMNIIAQQSAGASPKIGLSIGLPIGNHGSIGLGSSKLLSQDNQQEGLIILDMTDSTTNQALWRGTAEAIPMGHFSLRNEAKLKLTLKKLVMQLSSKK